MPKSTKRSCVAAAAAHEAFCVAVAGGMSQTDAYAEHVSKDSPYLNKSASTLAKRYRDRIAAIIAETTPSPQPPGVPTKQEAMEFLTAVVRDADWRDRPHKPTVPRADHTVGREEDSEGQDAWQAGSHRRPRQNARLEHDRES